MNENKMETIPVNKLLITMAAPMVLSMLIGALYNVVDSLFVSNYGENALSAVSLAFPIQNIIIATGTGIGVGINALPSRFLGEKKQKKVNQTALHGIILGIGFYILVLLFGIFCVKGFYMVQTNDTEIISMGVDYLTVICVFGYFGLPEMGTKGAPIATVVGQIIAMLLGLYFNLTKNTDVQFNFKSIELESYYFKGICTVGIPTIIMQSMSSVMCFGINKLLLDFSTTSTAVFGAYFKLQTFLYLTGNGVVQGMRPLIGYNYGAGESKRVREIFRSALVLIAGVMVIGTILCMAVPQTLIGLFTSNPETIQFGKEALRLISIGFIGLRHGIRCVGRTGKGKRIVGNFCAQVHSSYFTIGIYFE